MAEGDAAGKYLDGCGKLHRISGILSVLSAIPKEEWKKPLAAVLAGAGLIASIVVAILWYRSGRSFLLWKYITAVWNVVWMAWVGAIYLGQLRKKERKLKQPGPLGIYGWDLQC